MEARSNIKSDVYRSVNRNLNFSLKRSLLRSNMKKKKKKKNHWMDPYPVPTCHGLVRHFEWSFREKKKKNRRETKVGEDTYSDESIVTQRSNECDPLESFHVKSHEIRWMTMDYLQICGCYPSNLWILIRDGGNLNNDGIED